MKKVAILQSNYIPWKGYFDLLAAADEFILYDDMQYTRRDWRNRNKIKTPQGIQWITIPVLQGDRERQRIRDTMAADSQWAAAHWKAIAHNYRRAPHFDEIAEWLKPLYDSLPDNLSEINRKIIETICKYLGIKTQITNSWDYTSTGGKTERLVDLCKQAMGNEYISGPSAKCYINEDAFAESGIKLTWFDYDGYAEYPQLWGGFTHEVSILDLLFNCGRDSGKYMRYINK